MAVTDICQENSELEISIANMEKELKQVRQNNEREVHVTRSTRSFPVQSVTVDRM